MDATAPSMAVHTVWDFMQLHQQPRSADALIVLGSIDDRVARHAAWLADNFTYQHIVMTGGRVKRNSRQALWQEPTEAEHFYAVFKAVAAREHDVVLEVAAQNTGDNALNSYAALKKAGAGPLKTVMIGTKPYMERRAAGTFEAQWPDKNTRFFVSSAPRKITEYCTKQYPLKETIQIMVKDFYNMGRYASAGWQTPVSVPEAVAKAAKELKITLDNDTT